jgi:DNA-binding MarR family transcriptional regulator
MTRTSLNEIFKCKDKRPKNKAMYEDNLKYSYIPKDIAEYIGVHYATVSRAIRKIEREYEK